jgi:hypothetical protein
VATGTPSASRRLQVAAVELRVGALLLDDEDVDAQPAQAVDLDGGQLGEGGATEEGLRIGHARSLMQVTCPRSAGTF